MHSVDQRGVSTAGGSGAGMQGGDGSPSHSERMAQAGHGSESGSSRSGLGFVVVPGFTPGPREEEEKQRQGRPVAAMEQSRGRDQEDVDINSNHDAAGSRLHSASANQSLGSTTRSGSTKSWTSGTGSPSSSPPIACSGQDNHLTTCSEQAEFGVHDGEQAEFGVHGNEHVEQDRGHVHREMMQTVQEMKKRLPSERRSHSKASTVQALTYALSCVRQVQANSEYYKLLMCNGLEERKDAAVCTLEQLESITSEHTLKNTDSFVVVFSLLTGRVVYTSEQASTILNCRRKFLASAKFVELLFHQDVNVFYSHTAQRHLPPWSFGTESAAVLCTQVKSFFCRIRGGRDAGGEMRYNPFRITPYLLKVQGAGGDEGQPCCLALVERITSGYEAPRIPTDKRVFTSTHSPGCVFLEVDDRAVPLLGYLPQALIGTSVLTCLHPEDRPLMLAMHRKILMFAGQPPFEHCPVRFRCQNGAYITLDTSWSSFINPWSRKVAFIIGRHKVLTGPLNQDVFAVRDKAEPPVQHEDVKELQSTIYKLFLQPVHTKGSSGYGSLSSSHEHHISVASSSDSNGNPWEDAHREPASLQIHPHVDKVKWGRLQAYLASQKKLLPAGTAATDTHASLTPGGQGLEVRRLQGSLEEGHRKQLHVPSYQQIHCVDSIIRYLESCSSPALKRKCASLSITSSSSTSEEDKTTAAPALAGVTVHDDDTTLDGPVSAGSSVTAAAVVGAPLTDITLSDKAMSVVSMTSPCSYSSTIVHVPQPESEVTTLEDTPMGSEPTDPAPSPAPGPAHPAPSSSSTQSEEFQLVGLTKEVLSAHTQKEEQDYVDRFRHHILDSQYTSYLQQDNSSITGDYRAGPLSVVREFRAHSGRPKQKRLKPQGSSDSDGCRHSPRHYSLPPSPVLPPRPPRHYSLPPSPVLPPRPPRHYSLPPSPALPLSSHSSQPPYYPVGSLPGAELTPGGPEHLQLPPVQIVDPFMSPVVTVILPYTSTYALCSPGVPGVPGVPNVLGIPPPLFAPSPFVSMFDTSSQTGLSSMPPPPTALLDSTPAPPPWLEGEELEAARPTALFSSSRSSSPLQLNLLQEELPKPTEPQSSPGSPKSSHERLSKGEDAPSELGNHDAQSTSSALLDLLLHKDARSGTGSNVSGSASGESGGFLGWNGTSTSHTGSSNSSQYFASNDSSDTSQKIRKSQEVSDRCAFHEHLDHSLWTMIQHTPKPIMMTYQIHPRDPEQVLEQDREKLLLLQPLQPCFSQEQREELAEVHSWIQRHAIPKEINTQGCVGCNATAMENSSVPKTPRTPPTPEVLFPQDGPTEDLNPTHTTPTRTSPASSLS